MNQLADQLKQKSDQLAAVREISRAIAEARDLDDTLDLITRRTTEVMRVESCSIYLYNKTRDRLVLAATTGLKKEGIGEVYLPHGAGLTGWAAEYRQPIAVTNAFKDPRFYRVIGSGESKFPSLMAQPLISHNKVIGAVNVQTVNPHKFTRDEIELFGIITELAAIALEKAQLAHTAIIQEMHHRVKNNLQMIAMLLRLQMGQENTLSPQNVLNETINRVLSIATVHEMLSEAGVDKVGTLDLIRRVSMMVSGNMVNPAAKINIAVTGNNIELPSQRATSLALITNELLQNALEHGLAGRSEGQVSIHLANRGSYLQLKVCDNGRGLPPHFNPNHDLNLGLDIVRTTVKEDMQGEFYIGPAEPLPGTLVEITLPLAVIANV
ncbi:MAG: GAF domain-containing protein [Anaerolineae bacterium]|nr:GAF domain-containing protein [Anaerolineae bacterium]